jgi:hypothetical protein
MKAEANQVMEHNYDRRRPCRRVDLSARADAKKLSSCGSLAPHPDCLEDGCTSDFGRYRSGCRFRRGGGATNCTFLGDERPGDSMCWAGTHSVLVEIEQAGNGRPVAVPEPCEHRRNQATWHSFRFRLKRFGQSVEG